MADTMMVVSKEREKEEVNLEAWNKQTIKIVRDIVRKRPQQSAIPQPSQPPIALQTDVEDTNEDPFFQKLQELEVARKSGNVWMQQSSTTSSSAAAPSVALPLASPMVPSEPSQAPSVTTIYMQAPPDKGNAIHIRSWHRPWIAKPERAVYTWSGPFPLGSDLLATYVSTVIVPKQTMSFTPYVIMEIEGAGGQVNECVLIPDSKCVNTTWEYLRPPSKALGSIRPLALPWTLRLLDADRELLPYGKDHWVVQEVQVVRPDVTRLTIHNGGKTENLSREFATGEWLLIESNTDKQLRCKVLSVGPDTIDVQEHVDTSFRGANILHLHRQSCVIIETAVAMQNKK